MSRKKVKINQQQGLRCPKCNCADMRQEAGWNVRVGRRRKRICRNCGYHVYTTEQVNEPGPEVSVQSGESVEKS